MIANDRLLFIHVHKTGGQFVNRLLLEHLPGARRMGYHLPRSEAPAEQRDLPAFAFVRNPWDWYVSWYVFNAAAPQRNPIFRGVSDSGRLDFKASIDTLVHLGHPLHAALRERITSELPETRENNFGSGITRAVMRGFMDPDAGYLTWLIRYMCSIGGSMQGMRVGRVESLREDMPQLLESCGTPVPPGLSQAIATAPAVNVSPRQDYRSYYDAELRELVGERDWGIVEGHGYSF
jgi:hypothetical protein